MRAALSILFCCVMTAQPACAGAWLRDPETAFMSVSGTMRYLHGFWQSENSLYGEFGLAPRVTLGVDINETPGIAGHLFVFARVPVGPADRRTKVAFEFGLGAHHWLDQWGMMVKSGISVGRSFTNRWGDGWFNIDTALELRRPNPDPAFKLDATLGLFSGRRIRPLLQFESTYVPDNPLIWSISPVVLIDGRNNTTWLIGLERKTAGRSSPGLIFATWRRF